ncbi:MAG: uracil-DNA glycosylase [Alphaproteobacteria bacterium]|nr:uracil-DNA glycosylase [Alphaproteobacteria bacterium]
MKKKLLWLIQAGISEIIEEKPTLKSLQPSQKNTAIPATYQAEITALQATTLDELNNLKNNFSQCPLHKTATHTLMGQGVTTPSIMCIVCAPNAESDKTGIAFSGDSGALLNRMLKAIGLDRTSNTYCTYLSPWRAPGNRKLTDTEIAMIKPFLDKEIELIKPKILLLFGAELSKALLNIDTLSKARHIWHTYKNIPTRVSLSLDTIKTTTQRQQAWEDLQEVQKKLS